MTLERPLARYDGSPAAILGRLRANLDRLPPPAPVFPVGTDIDRDRRAGLAGTKVCPHFHIVGASGTGKSYLIELLCCRLLWLHCIVPDRAPGMMVLDPHGTLYDRLLRRLAEFHIPPANVILIELDNDQCLPAFQPLDRHGTSVAYQCGAFLKACAKVWGQEVFDQTPQLRRWLKNVVWPCIEAGAAPSEFEALLSLGNEESLRDAILKRCTNSAVLRAWRQEFRGYKTVGQKMERAIGSSVNRLEGYFDNTFLRRLFGQTNPAKTIDWRAVMDASKIVLVKLTGGALLPTDDVNMVGVLLLNEIVRAAKRPPYRTDARAFYVLADEFQRLVNKDFLELLTETRKFKVHAWLSHQDPAALRELDPELYLAAMTCARGKVIFAGVHTEELEPLIRDAYAGVFDADLVKFDLSRTFFHPFEERREVHTSMQSHSRGHGAVAGWSEGFSEASSAATAVQLDGLMVPMATGFSTTTTGSSSGYSSARSRATAISESETEAEGISVVPFYRLEERRELSSRQFRDLNEQLQIAVNRVHSLPNQHCLVVVPGQPPAVVKVHDLPDPRVSKAEVEAYRQAVFAEAGCYATPEQVDAEIARRQQAFLDEWGKEEAVSRPARNGQVSRPKPLPPVDPVARLQEQVRTLDPADALARRKLLGEVALLRRDAQQPILDHLALRVGMTKTALRRELQALKRTGRNGRCHAH